MTKKAKASKRVRPYLSYKIAEKGILEQTYKNRNSAMDAINRVRHQTHKKKLGAILNGIPKYQLKRLGKVSLPKEFLERLKRGGYQTKSGARKAVRKAPGWKDEIRLIMLTEVEAYFSANPEKTAPEKTAPTTSEPLPKKRRGKEVPPEQLSLFDKLPIKPLDPAVRLTDEEMDAAFSGLREEKPKDGETLSNKLDAIYNKLNTIECCISSLCNVDLGIRLENIETCLACMNAQKHAVPPVRPPMTKEEVENLKVRMGPGKPPPPADMRSPYHPTRYAATPQKPRSSAEINADKSWNELFEKERTKKS